MAYKEYEESEQLQRMRQQMEQQQAGKPGAYQSQYGQQINDLMGQINNRQPFRFNLATNPLYNQYRQQYMRQGNMAMQDTIGQAATLNGGYGSSYAQTAGQQVYNNHINQLNDRIPELYSMALSKYSQEGADLQNRLGMMQDAESREYSRYRDAQSDWQGQMDRLQDAYNRERSFDYGRYQDDRAYAAQQEQRDYDRSIDERNWNYSQQLDERSQQQQAQSDARSQVEWLLQHGYDVPQNLIDAAGLDEAYLNGLRDHYNKPTGGSGYKPKDEDEDEDEDDDGDDEDKQYGSAAYAAQQAANAGYSRQEIQQSLQNAGVSASRAQAAAHQASVMGDLDLPGLGKKKRGGR